MPSSISGSKHPAVTYAKVLACVCVILIVVLEISSGYLLKHRSPTYDRISPQYEDALKIQRAEPGGLPSVLMVGNSLLLHGVEVDRLRTMTSSSMRIYPLFLEGTGYYDWLYGLQRLFRQGSRPQVVVLGVGVNYLLRDGVRQDYVPMMFMDAKDTLAVASELHMDHTATSNLLLEHSSVFWDTRSAMRMQVLNHMVPRVEDLFLFLTPQPAVPQGREFEEIAIPRLRRLVELCESNGAKFILLLPPTLSSESAINQMVYDARLVGADVSVPIDPSTLSEKFYKRDGMHLNQDGAVLFTSALAKDLPNRVATHDTLTSQVAH